VPHLSSGADKLTSGSERIAVIGNGSAQEEKAFSQSCELGSGGGDIPLDRDPSSTRWRHPIRAGLVRVPRGSKAQWSMGWLQGKGSTKAPFLGLDEFVSMKWSGVLGAGTPAKSMGAGRAKSPASGETAIRLMALEGFNTLEEPRSEGCNGSAQRAPLPRCGVLPRTSCGRDLTENVVRCSNVKHGKCKFRCDHKLTANISRRARDVWKADDRKLPCDQ